MASPTTLHVLLVEDDPITIHATTATLERLGYTVRAETNGLDALLAFTEAPHSFDLALLDHGLGDITGLELAQRFRRIRPDFPVVLYTGYLGTPTPEELKAAAIRTKVLAKPASREELGGALGKALKGSLRGKPRT